MFSLQLPTPTASYSFPVCVCVFKDKRSPVVNCLSSPSLPRCSSYLQPVQLFADFCRGSVFVLSHRFVSTDSLLFCRLWRRQRWLVCLGSGRHVEQRENAARPALDGPSLRFFRHHIREMGSYSKIRERGREDDPCLLRSELL